MASVFAEQAHVDSVHQNQIKKSAWDAHSTHINI